LRFPSLRPFSRHFPFVSSVSFCRVARVAVPAPEVSSTWGSVFRSRNCHVGVGVPFFGTHLHASVGRVNLFSCWWHGREQIEIPVSPSIIAATAV
jgi:hypothetical protein